MIHYKIKTENKGACETALSWYKTKAVIGDDGNKKIGLQNPIDFLHDMAVDELLYKNISIKPSIPEYIKRDIINKTITRWLRFRKYKKMPDTVKAFEDALLIELKKNLKLSNYCVISLLNIAANEGQFEKSFEIDGCKINVLSWAEINDFDLNLVWENARNRLPKTIDKIFDNPARMTSIYKPVMITVTSHNERDALYQAIKCLDYFRVALNFATATNLLVKFGKIYPLAKISPSSVFAVFNSENNLVYDVYSETPQKYLSRETITDNDYSTFEAIFEKLSSEDGLWNLITRLLYLYQQALDLADGTEVFLALWRVLEASVLDTPQKAVNIKGRVTKLTGIEKDPILKHSLSSLEYYRNNLVHRGDFPNYSDPLIFTLKKIVDITLHKLISLSTQLNEEAELKEYLMFLSTNNKDLSRKSKVVNLLLTQRQAA